MRRRFAIAFVALFALFAVGISVSLVFIWRGSRELEQVLSSHQIEDLRQDLSRSLERSQKDLQVSGTVFANQLDDIIGNVQALDRSVDSCFDCHHTPALRGELERISELVETYKEQYSTFITAFLNAESRQRLQFEAAATAAEIDEVVDAMLLAAGPRLQRRTEAASAQVERSWTSLVVTLLLTFVVAILISSFLTRSVVEPLDRLVGAAGRISAGDLGFRIAHDERHELGTLMDAFNEMSETLESKTERIESYVAKLHRLNEGIVSLHAQSDEGSLFAHQVEAIDSLMDVELRGSVLPTELEGVFQVSLSERGEAAPRHREPISASKLEQIRGPGGPPMTIVGAKEAGDWPFGPWQPERQLRNYLVCWIDWQGGLVGALIVANRISGEFAEEDGELLAALGQSLRVALENAREFRRLRNEMELLKSRDGATAGKDAEPSR